jgi:hypothetical protein
MPKKSSKKVKSCLTKEFRKLTAKKKKHPSAKQRVAIALSVCGISKKRKK